ncbi:hypothetical protein ACTXT7_001533 [Hymenolepis weldensis]
MVEAGTRDPTLARSGLSVPPSGCSFFGHLSVSPPLMYCVLQDTMSVEDTASTEKIAKIETFVNEKLRNDLKRVLDAGDTIYGEISGYLELQNLLEKFSEMDVKSGGDTDKEGMETMVGMGLNFYLKANIPSLEKLYVDVGLGFHIELTHTEALECIRQRIEFLNEKAEVFRKKAFEIRAQIRVSLETLRILQKLDFKTRPDYRDALL